MNCWIGIDHTEGRRVVRLVGEFRGAQVPELLIACDPSLGSRELDLSELVCVDTAGLEALRRLKELGVSLVGTPAYVQLKLESMPPGSSGSDTTR